MATLDRARFTAWLFLFAGGALALVHGTTGLVLWSTGVAALLGTSVPILQMRRAANRLDGDGDGDISWIQTRGVKSLSQHDQRGLIGGETESSFEREPHGLKTLIAEDHTLVSHRLEAMLSAAEGVDLVGVVSSGAAAIEVAEREHVNVILMDVNLGEAMNGIEVTRFVKERSPSTLVLILTTFTDPGIVAEALKAGADGYLLKSASKEVIVQAIKDVAAGKPVLDPNAPEGIFGRTGRGVQALTDRELTVLQQLALGRSPGELAELLHVSEQTVKTYLKQIFRKLEVHDGTEAVAEAFRRGLVD